MTDQSNKTEDDLKMPADEFDWMMRKAAQVSSKGMPKREKVARKSKMRHNKHRAGK